jgi:hypothetical protein
VRAVQVSQALGPIQLSNDAARLVLLQVQGLSLAYLWKHVQDGIDG